MSFKRRITVRGWGFRLGEKTRNCDEAHLNFNIKCHEDAQSCYEAHFDVISAFMRRHEIVIRLILISIICIICIWVYDQGFGHPFCNVCT